MKKNIKISTKISVLFSIITVIVSILFYFLLPNLLNYPPDTINTPFDKEVSKLYYIYQYAIAIGAILLIFIVFFKISLRKLDNWILNKTKTNISEIRDICFSYPFKLFVTIEIFPVCIVLLTLILTGSHTHILLFKIGILVFSFATLVSSLFLIISKKVFHPILNETSNKVKNPLSKKRDSITTKLVFEIFPSILITVLLTALIGYSRLTVEKGNLLETYYKSELENVKISDSDNLMEQLKYQINPKLLNKNDFIFIESPTNELIIDGNHTITDFFIKYMHTLSPSHDNRVYETYTVDEQGIIRTITYQGQDYTIGIHFEIVSSSLLSYLLLSSGLLFLFNLIILIYMVKSIDIDLTDVTNGMKNILHNKDNLDGSNLPITSNDIVGELVKSFNDIQDLTKNNIDTIHNNQNMLMERERLASLGQLIGGIAHNLKTPIMSISGAAEGLSDLVNEFDNSIGNPIVNNDDLHDIAKDMNEWLEKIRSYTEYMSDILTAVKGQAVTLSDDESISFTVGELFKRVDILMKHELKKAVVYLNISMKVDENTTLKGNVNSLVQVINNMISNAIQSYNGEPNKNIDLLVTREEKNIIITIRDYGPGLPTNVKQKLFKEMITTKGKNGTGLGLYMSYSNIKAHFHGDITFESEEGKGTSFHIILPI